MAERATLSEVKEILIKATARIDDMLRRVEKNEDNIGKLWKANNEQAVAIARTQQWIQDHERREAFLIGVATLVISAMVWLSGWVLK